MEKEARFHDQVGCSRRTSFNKDVDYLSGWRKVVDVNLTGTFLMAQAVLPRYASEPFITRYQKTLLVSCRSTLTRSSTRT